MVLCHTFVKNASMQILNILLIFIPLALAPGVGIVFFIYFRDKFEKEPFRLLRNCFLFGMLSIVPAIFIEIGFGKLGIDENQNLLKTLVYAFFVVGIAEEMSKFFFLRMYAYRKKDFNEPFDGIVYVMYVIMGGLSAAVLRMFTAVPLHAVCAIFMGYFVGKAKFSKHPVLMMVLGCAMAVFMHGLYDFFLFQQEMTQLAILSFVALAAAVGISFVAINKSEKISPFKTVAR